MGKGRDRRFASKEALALRATLTLALAAAAGLALAGPVQAEGLRPLPWARLA